MQQCLKAVKMNDFYLKKRDIFVLIFAQNIDCGYTLGGSNTEAVLTSTYNLCSRAKIRKKYAQVNHSPVNSSFTILKWGVRGSSLHGHVCMMFAW